MNKRIITSPLILVLCFCLALTSFGVSEKPQEVAQSVTTLSAKMPSVITLSDITTFASNNKKNVFSVKVKGSNGKTVTYTEETVLDTEMALWAYNKELLGYVGNYDRDGDVEPEGSALLYLAIGEYQDKNGSVIRDRTLSSVKNLISGDKEPGFNAGPNHSYPPVALALAVVRHTPTVWDKLSKTEKSKIDLIMECFAIATCFVTDDDNYYKTGPALTGNFYKTWNPNHRLAMVIPIVASTLYFSAEGKDGAAYVNNIFKNFNYDSYISKFNSAGFARAKYHWTAGGFKHTDGTYVPNSEELMMKGGTAYVAYADNSNTNHSKRTKLSALEDGGYGVGIKGNTYTYFGMGLDDIGGILKKLYEVTYAGGTVVSDTSLLKGGADANGNPLAYIADGSKSPVEGENGMMYEFKSSDGGGFRSSSSYNTHNFVSVVQSLTVTDLLGSPVFSKKDAFFRQIWVGNTNLIYKNEVGYMNYSLGKQQGIKGDDNHPYYLPWKSWWKENYGDSKFFDEWDKNVILGDADGTGEIDLDDLSTLAKYIACWKIVAYSEAALDFSGDGEVNLLDLVLLAQHIAGWNVTLT